MQRAQTAGVMEDLERKIVLLTGPRQCGKTTLSKMLFAAFEYFNYDDARDRVALGERSWRREVPLVVFDELHKMAGWKGWLKGIYDTEGGRPRLLVTGSAKLDAYRKMGDSLAGRFFLHRLHPLDLKELVQAGAATDGLARLLRFGGFPEPLLADSEAFAGRWRRAHQDIILRQDLLDLEAVRDIKAIETLTELLRRRVGAPVSYSNLARDLQRDPKTVKRWLDLLEGLYVVFRVTPFHRNVARALLKEPRFYFFDTGQVAGGVGPRLENLVACALLKEAHRQEDATGERIALHYLRTKDGREVDFLLLRDDAPSLMAEVKWADATPSPALHHFAKELPGVPRLQVVGELRRDKQYPNGLRVVDAARWLGRLDLTGAPQG